MEKRKGEGLYRGTLRSVVELYNPPPTTRPGCVIVAVYCVAVVMAEDKTLHYK